MELNVFSVTLERNGYIKLALYANNHLQTWPQVRRVESPLQEYMISIIDRTIKEMTTKMCKSVFESP